MKTPMVDDVMDSYSFCDFGRFPCLPSYLVDRYANRYATPLGKTWTPISKGVL